MEDLLRAYAKKRREQGRQELPSELGAASRRMLHEEARRAFGNGRREGGGVAAWRWLASQWPRLALGGGLAALLILVVARSAPPVATRTPAAMPVSGTAAQMLSSRSSFQANLRGKSLGQQFVQVNNGMQSRNGASVGGNVLATFQMERQGQNVLVIDGDGSVYRGRVLEPEAAKKGVAPKDQSIVYDKLSEAGEDFDKTANYSFEVSGRNNGLQQNVVFIGNVLQMPQAATTAAGAPSGAAGGGGAPVASEQQPVEGQLAGRGRAYGAGASRNPGLSNQIQAGARQQVQQVLRITGKVQVEGGGGFEIEAQPPGP
ncbi:MAG TPA: hypothetical protein VMR33_11185 [Candidatus Baltobacteraceae bacterium]|nr:hypothetical protein [Candidatus Baltobacteraceae bacterium]